MMDQPRLSMLHPPISHAYQYPSYGVVRTVGAPSISEAYQSAAVDSENVKGPHPALTYRPIIRHPSGGPEAKAPQSLTPSRSAPGRLQAASVEATTVGRADHLEGGAEKRAAAQGLYSHSGGVWSPTKETKYLGVKRAPLWGERRER